LLKREEDVRAMLRNAGAEPGERLSFFATDLERDDSWAAAVGRRDFVIHVPSPLPLSAPKTEDEVIVPARDGLLRVLKFARDANAALRVRTAFGARLIVISIPV
jgi:hypothetical protein